MDLLSWVKNLPGDPYENIEPASSDASFRRYFRIWRNECTFIVMDAPPLKENSEKFVQFSELFRRIKINCPDILESNIQEGFLLLTDLGSDHYLDALVKEPKISESLYIDALAVLHVLQSEGKSIIGNFSTYDETMLVQEMNLFPDWFCLKELGITFNKDELFQWQNCVEILLKSALIQPQVIVHRDFHSRNLIYTKDHNPGVLDFQDAVIGPITYDIVSLLRDCYISLPDELLNQLLETYYLNLDISLKDKMSKKEFIRFFDLMGIQRHLKATGIFARLKHRDGKNNYLKDIPRTLHYIYSVTLKYPELGFLNIFLKNNCLAYKGS